MKDWRGYEIVRIQNEIDKLQKELDLLKKPPKSMKDVLADYLSRVNMYSVEFSGPMQKQQWSPFQDRCEIIIKGYLK